MEAGTNLIAAATKQKQDRAPQPQSVDIAAFANVVALFDLAQKIGLVELLDRHIPKRNQGLSVGQYLLLAAINRAVHPTSKRQFANWYRETALVRLLPATAEQLSSQAFWNHLDFVEAHHIEAVERELSQRLIELFQLSLRTLTYDGTKFLTFLDTRSKATLSQRGHNKQKRNDLRQVSLGMLVSTDFHVPLFHKVYAGNFPDCSIFETVTEELRVRYQEPARDCEHITLVFDKGNSSEEAFQTRDDTDFHFIGSLVPSHHAALLEVPASRYQPLSGERLKDVRAHRTKKEIYGCERTIVVTHNDNLLNGRLQGLTAALEKARGKLRDLQTKLRRRREGRTRGGKAPTVASIRKQAHEALAGQHVKNVLRVEVTDGDVPALTFQTDQGALARLIDKQLGKRILFTDNDDWTNEEIVLGYRSQHHIEDAFRQMKHPHYLGWQPMFHWTDSKIRVHAFTCVTSTKITCKLALGWNSAATLLNSVSSADITVKITHPRRFIMSPDKQITRRRLLKAATVGASGAITAALFRPPAHGANVLADAGVADPRIEGPFLILSTPFTASGAVDFDALARQACYVAWCGCPGMIWPQAGDAVDLLTTDEKLKGMEVLAKTARKLNTTALCLGVQGKDTAEMLMFAEHVEQLAPAAIISRPPDLGKTEDDLRQYWHALASVTKRPVFIQTTGGVAYKGPVPSVDLLIELARDLPNFGYVKEEAGNVIARTRALLAAKPPIRRVFSARGGYGWLYELRLGSEGLITERAIYADVLTRIWQLHKSGSDPAAVRDAYSKFVLMINLARTHPGDLRGYQLYLWKERGVFQTMVSRHYGPGGTIPTSPIYSDLELSEEEIAEIEYRFEALKPYQQPGSPDFAAAVQ